MPSVVAVCDIRTLNVMKGRYPKYRQGEDRPTGALWVPREASQEDIAFMIGFYAEGSALKVLRIFAHASPGKILLGQNPLDWITATGFGNLVRKKFADGGRIELHCCNATADEPILWQGLANAAQVEVWASPDRQKGKTIGFDGRLVKYRPRPRKNS